MDNFEIDFLAFDLSEGASERFQRALDVGLQHDPQDFPAVDRFEQSFERGALRRRQFARAFREANGRDVFLLASADAARS